MLHFDLPISWREIVTRTAKETIADDCLGLAAQLSYYLFLALFPAILFLLALGSFFPLQDLTGDVVRLLQPIASREIITLLAEQMQRISEQEDGGLLTFGVLAALWSSSAAMVAVTSSLNAAYDIEEGRPWWKVRLIAIGLTVALAVFFLLSFTLVLAGPTMAEYLGRTLHLGAIVEWSWKILQWPIAFLLVSTAIGIVYYVAPDAEQDWVWISPGALVATVLWLVASLGFKVYVTRFADYNATYGAIGGVMVLMLWFYVSSLAILVGAEMNAEIEHASPHGKEPGEKRPGERRMIGARAARAWRERQFGRRGAPAGSAVASGADGTSRKAEVDGTGTPAVASSERVPTSTETQGVRPEPGQPAADTSRSKLGVLVAAALTARLWRRARSSGPRQS
jgi:membrane protein